MRYSIQNDKGEVIARAEKQELADDIAAAFDGHVVDHQQDDQAVA